MSRNYVSLLSSPATREAQMRYYGKPRAETKTGQIDQLTPEEIEFIGARDSFYLGTVTADGWPYIQHRGGRTGFVRVLNPGTLGFADFGGNRQLISVGNIETNSRVSLFFMDYPQRFRLKVLGHAKVEDARDHPELVKALAEPEDQEQVERLFLIEVVSFDWNCSQFITPRYSLEELEEESGRHSK